MVGLLCDWICFGFVVGLYCLCGVLYLFSYVFITSLLGLSCFELFVGLVVLFVVFFVVWFDFIVCWLFVSC